MPETQEPDPEVTAYVPIIKRLYAFLQDVGGVNPGGLRALQLLKAGMKPGAPFRFYFDLIRQHFGDKVDNSEQVAADLLMLLSISEDTSSDITSGWQRESEYIYSSLEAIQIVGIAMKTLNNKYLAWQASHPETAQ